VSARRSGAGEGGAEGECQCKGDDSRRGNGPIPFLTSCSDIELARWAIDKYDGQGEAGHEGRYKTVF
jgi:hypothetical protein